MNTVPAGLRVLQERVRLAVSHLSFFPFLQCLERELAPDALIGSDVSADRERVHFTHPPSFAFPGGEVAEVAYAEEADGLAATVTTSLLGLLGAESPLPAGMSEEVLFDDEDGGLQAFYDVFQHRALALLYRAWKRYALVAASETAGDDAFQGALLSLMGIDHFSPYDVPAAVEPTFALGLSDFARCEPGYLDAAGLEQILWRVFPELCPRVTAAEPRVVLAADEDRTGLGVRNTTMGEDATYGSSARDLQGVVRIVVGPVDRATHDALMPGSRRYAALQGFVEHWLAARATAELEVLVKGSEAPALRLGDSYGATLGAEARYSKEAPREVCVRIPLLGDTGDVVRSYRDVA
jgi:type VI secretion system protein ImpH